MKHWIVLISLLTVLPASARLGDTAQQLETRYGKAETGSDPTRLSFHKNGIDIEAILWKGVCHSIKFNAQTRYQAGKDGQLIETNSRLSKDEIQHLLEVNGRSGIWKSPPAKGGVIHWTTSDGQFQAWDESSTLLIKTTEFVDFEAGQKMDEETRRKAEQEQRLKGF